MAADSVSPDSTCPLTSYRTFWKFLLGVCEARMSRHCTMGRPASIIVANWRVKTTMSFSGTPWPMPKGSLSSMSLAFFFALDSVMPWARSRFATSGSASASIVPLRTSPARVRPSQANTAIYLNLDSSGAGPAAPSGRRRRSCS
jgi:hypothetical protein